MKSGASASKSRRSTIKSDEKETPEKRSSNQNPSRRHREKLNTVLEELSCLLPLQSDAKKKLDKLSVLKLTVSFFQTQNLVRGKRKPIEGPVSDGAASKKAKKELDVSNLALEAIGGFFVILTEDANVFYISENVHSYLGYTQTHMMHQDFLSYINQDDIENIRECISRPLPNTNIKRESYQSCQEGLRQTCFCNVKCHAGRLTSHVSPFYYKCFKFDGHVRLLTMDDMSGQRQFGFFAVCTPVTRTVSVLRSIKESIKGYTCKLDASFKDIKLDNRGMKNLHLNEKDLRGISAYVFFHPEDIKLMALAHEKIMATGIALTAFRVQDGKGNIQWVRGKGTAIFGSDGQFNGLLTENIFISDEEGHYYKDLHIKEMNEWKHSSLTCSETSDDQENNDMLQFRVNDQGDLIVTPCRTRKRSCADITELPSTVASLSSPISSTSSLSDPTPPDIPEKKKFNQYCLLEQAGQAVERKPLILTGSDLVRTSLSAPSAYRTPLRSEDQRSSLSSYARSSHGSFSSDTESSLGEIRRNESSSTFSSEDTVFEDWNTPQSIGNRQDLPMDSMNGYEQSLPNFTNFEQLLMDMKNMGHASDPSVAVDPSILHSISNVNISSNNIRAPRNLAVGLESTSQFSNSETPGLMVNPGYAAPNASVSSSGSQDDMEGLRLDDLKSLLSLADIFAPKEEPRGKTFAAPATPSLHHTGVDYVNPLYPLSNTTQLHSLSQTVPDPYPMQIKPTNGHNYSTLSGIATLTPGNGYQLLPHTNVGLTSLDHGATPLPSTQFDAQGFGVGVGTTRS